MLLNNIFYKDKYQIVRPAYAGWTMFGLLGFFDCLLNSGSTYRGYF